MPAVELLEEILNQTADPVLCESVYESEYLKYPPHEAQWYALSPCGDVTAMCEDRRQLCIRHKGWTCNPGCRAFHSFGSVRWTAIQP